LPLHMARIKDITSGEYRYALDKLTISYVPNVRALTLSRNIAEHVAPDSLLAIDEPYPVQAAALPNSKIEVDAVTSHFTSARVLRREEATLPAVQELLTKEPIPTVWHFSCHGAAGLTDPLESGLLMAYDEWLTLRDLLALRLPGVRL